MPEKVVPGPVQDSACIREAVCIDTKKIFDSCKEEDIAPPSHGFRFSRCVKILNIVVILVLVDFAILL